MYLLVATLCVLHGLVTAWLFWAASCVGCGGPNSFALLLYWAWLVWFLVQPKPLRPMNLWLLVAGGIAWAWALPSALFGTLISLGGRT
jgi:hypothetical protein